MLYIVPKMNQAYWDTVAAQYDTHILDAMANDRHGIIRACIEEHADASATAADFGCGVGKTLPLLASHFSMVDAYDLSPKNIAIARQACDRHKNLRYRQADLAKARLRRGAFDFAVSINVLLTPSHEIRSAIIRSIASSLRSGGRLLLVAPSIESALYADARLVEWNMREGYAHDEARKQGLAGDRKVGGRVANGIVRLDGVETKHYLREELQIALQAAGLHTLRTEKVEYSWHTEFDDAPRWMQEPFPWDWMVLAERC